jgi:hypothetical protein
MFSTKTKRQIADAVQRILRDTKDWELPQGEITFHLHVDGDDPNMSWADIRNNGAVAFTPEEQEALPEAPAFAGDMRVFYALVPKKGG